MPAVDILLLSNGPGEVSTWVRPVVKALRQRFGDDRAQVRLSLVLSPCPNATGQEPVIAGRYPEIDRIQAAEYFWPFLLWGKTAERWDWRSQGVVIFLGGDQFFTVVIGKRLGYRTVTYAEWEALWPRWIDRFGVRQAEGLKTIPAAYHSKFKVIGDLMAEVGQGAQTQLIPSGGQHSQPPDGGADQDGEEEWVGFLPGSKGAKLSMGVPLLLAIADYLHRHRPRSRCFIPVAPTLTMEALNRYAQPEHNPMVTVMGGPQTQLLRGGSLEASYFQTAGGARIELVTTFPAYDRLAHCQLCVTTVGANTAELGALGVPMFVLLPTQQLDAMRAWNGIPGLLANLPGVGTLLAKGINWFFLRRMGLLAWPNIWAGEMIVPELVGHLTGDQVGAMVVEHLAHPEKLAQIRDRLRQVRGEAGAAEKLVALVAEVLNQT